MCIVWSLRRHRAVSPLLLAMAVFPLPAVHVQSGEGNAADGRHQQEPDEDLTEDGVLHHLRLSLKQQYSYCLSPHTLTQNLLYRPCLCAHGEFNHVLHRSQ